MLSLRLAPLFLLGFGPAVGNTRQTDTVTYTTVAVPLSQALSALSKQVHYPLITGGYMAKQPIIISVQNAPANEVLTRIAKVTFSFWRKSGDGYELVQNSAAMRAAQDARRNRLRKSYEKQISDSLANVQKQGALTSEKADAYLTALDKQQKQAEDQARRRITQVETSDAQDSALDLVLPAQHALDEALAAIGSEALADVGQGQRVVFSTNPNRMQRAIGDASGQILGEYQSSAKIWNQAVAKMPQDTTGEGTNFSIGMMGSQKGLEAVYKMDVVASRRGGNGLSVSLKVLDASLNVADQSEETLGDDFQTETESVPEKADGKRDDYKIPLTPESHWLFALSAAERISEGFVGSRLHVQTTPARPRMPDGMDQKLLQPDKYDPLCWVQSELLIGLAQHKKLQLVALLPDSTSSYSSYLEYSADAVMDQFGSDMDLSFENKNGWLQVAPTDPGAAFQSRTDRGDLAKLLQQLHEQKVSRLDAYGDYFAKHYAEDETFCSQYCSLVSGDGTDFSDLGGKLQLAFYGDLPPATRAQLAGGKPIELANLNQDAQSVLQELIYNSEDCQLEVKTPDKDPVQVMTRGNNEPTELLPGGIPQQGLVSLDQTNSDVAKAQVQAGTNGFQDGSQQLSYYTSYVEPQSIAMFLVMKENPKYNFPFIEKIDMSNILLLHRTMLQFNFQFTPVLSASISLDDKRPFRKEPYTWETLPADFKKAINDAKPQAKEMLSQLPADFGSQMRQISTGPGSQQKPPP